MLQYARRRLCPIFLVKENTIHVLYRILNGFLTICFSVSHLDRGDSAAGSVSTNRPVPPFTIVGMCLSENTSSAGSVNLSQASSTFHYMDPLSGVTLPLKPPISGSPKHHKH